MDLNRRLSGLEAELARRRAAVAAPPAVPRRPFDVEKFARLYRLYVVERRGRSGPAADQLSEAR